MSDNPVVGSYWNKKGKYQKEMDTLWASLVPPQGEADTPEGKIVLAAGRIYYEYFNNGGCNAIDDDGRISDLYRGFLETLAQVPRMEEILIKVRSLLRNGYKFNTNSPFDEMYDKVYEHVSKSPHVPFYGSIPVEDFFKVVGAYWDDGSIHGHLRLGQYLVNHYKIPELPEVFYAVDSKKVMSIFVSRFVKYP